MTPLNVRGGQIVKRRRSIYVNEGIYLAAHNHDTGEILEGTQAAIIIYVSRWAAEGNSFNVKLARGFAIMTPLQP